MFSDLVPDTIPTWIGLCGVLLYLTAYAALQLGLLRARGYAYPMMNLVAAVCTLIGLMESFNLSSALIQIIWIVISVAGMVRLYWMSRPVQFESHELTLREGKFAGLEPADFRQLLDAGQWHDGQAGDVLTVEGEPVNALYYLLDGHARVTFDGVEVAICAPGSLIGEGGVLDGDAATATVRLSEQGRYFSVDGNKLASLVRRNGDLGAHLRRKFSGDLRGKLMESNRGRSVTDAESQRNPA